jgi:hypothetical protein
VLPVVDDRRLEGADYCGVLGARDGGRVLLLAVVVMVVVESDGGGQPRVHHLLVAREVSAAKTHRCIQSTFVDFLALKVFT